MKSRKIGIAISYDMGWQKRSTGKVYDSISGHGYLIGCRTGKILGMQVRQTKCKKFQARNSNGTPAATHDCMVNWDGGSGAMEAAVAMDLIVAVHDKMDSRVYCETLVLDDDSTMRSHLQHSENGGKLDNSIPQPDFLADPSHRIKVMAAPIFKLVKDTKNPHECKKIDAMRVKKYIGCYIYKNRNLPLDEFVRRARAPIEHLFDCHKWCDKEWCWAKELDDAQHKVILSNMKQKEEEDLPACSSSSSEDSGSGSESDTYQSESAKLSDVDSDSVEWSDDEAVSSDSATVGSLDSIESEEMNEAKYFYKTRWNLRPGRKYFHSC